MKTEISEAIALLRRNGYTVIYPSKTMDDVLEEWIEYKKERKQTYKKRGLEMCKKKLFELSNGNPRIAQMIVEQSMANNWAGLFGLKSENKQNMPVGMVLHNESDKYENDKGW